MRDEMSGGRQHATATLRNRDFILDAFGMSCRQPASSLKSRAAQASTSSISQRMFLRLFSNLPILI